MSNISDLKKIEIDYHIKQWDTPYRSTVFFYEFVKKYLKKSNKVIDLGCGIGSNTYYISNFHKKCKFIGIDYSKKYIEIGNNIVNSKNSKNLRLIKDDCFNLKNYTLRFTDEQILIHIFRTLPWISWTSCVSLGYTT